MNAKLFPVFNLCCKSNKEKLKDYYTIDRFDSFNCSSEKVFNTSIKKWNVLTKDEKIACANYALKHYGIDYTFPNSETIRTIRKYDLIISELRKIISTDFQISKMPDEHELLEKYNFNLFKVSCSSFIEILENGYNFDEFKGILQCSHNKYTISCNFKYIEKLSQEFKDMFKN